LVVLEYQLLVGGAEGNIVKYSDVRVTQTYWVIMVVTKVMAWTGLYVSPSYHLNTQTLYY